MLHILAPDDPALTVLKEAINTHASPDLHLDIIPWVDYRETLMRTLQAPSSPYHAVFVPGHIWIPELAEAGYLSPLEPLLASLPTSLIDTYDSEDILPSVTTESSYLGQQYQLPFFSDGHILFCHKAHMPFSAEGGVPIISTRDIATYAANTHMPPSLYGLALKADQSEILTDFLPYLWEAEGRIFDDTGKPDLCNTNNITALTYYCSLRTLCPPSTDTYGNAEIADALRTGEAALIATWGGQSAPIMLEAQSTCKEMYRAATFPVPWNATWGVSLPANQAETTQQEMLTALLQLLGTQQDQEIILAAGSPVRKSSYSEKNLAQYPWLSAQKKMLELAKPLPKNPKLGLFLGDLYTAVHKAFTGEMTAAEALCFAQEKAMVHYTK